MRESQGCVYTSGWQLVVYSDISEGKEAGVTGCGQVRKQSLECGGTIPNSPWTASSLWRGSLLLLQVQIRDVMEQGLGEGSRSILVAQSKPASLCSVLGSR